MENVLETIGQALHELNFHDKADSDTVNTVNTALDLFRESYILVMWPESQELMEEPWFDDEAVLDVNCKFGSSAYFIPAKYLIK